MYKYEKLKTFVRYGKFHITKQTGYNRSDTYHSPPAPKGFYCMPMALQCRYLISSIGDSQKTLKGNGYFPKDFNEFNATYKRKLGLIYHKFTIPRDFYIWHHLDDAVKESNIIDRNKSWIKTSFNDYIDAVNRVLMRDKAFNLAHFQTPARHWLCYDYFEVFIDEKIN